MFTKHQEYKLYHHNGRWHSLYTGSLNSCLRRLTRACRRHTGPKTSYCICSATTGEVVVEVDVML